MKLKNENAAVNRYEGIIEWKWNNRRTNKNTRKYFLFKRWPIMVVMFIWKGTSDSLTKYAKQRNIMPKHTNVHSVFYKVTVRKTKNILEKKQHDPYHFRSLSTTKQEFHYFIIIILFFRNGAHINHPSSH